LRSSAAFHPGVLVRWWASQVTCLCHVRKRHVNSRGRAAEEAKLRLPPRYQLMIHRANADLWNDYDTLPADIRAQFQTLRNQNS